MKIIFAGAMMAVLTLTGAAANHHEQRVRELLRPRVLELAEAELSQEPVTVTAFRAARSAGGPHDFFSEGDYWWPDPQHPDGPYIRRDGESNPNNFTAHRKAMTQMSMTVGNLTSAWLLTGDRRYVDAVVRHVKAWFMSPQTMMTPNLLYAQAIKGVATGRGIGIIDTMHLVEVAQSLLRLHLAGVLPDDVYTGTQQWFASYLHWMMTHPYGIAEMNATNNHGTCWAVQAAMFAKYTGNDSVMHFCANRYKTVFIDRQMDARGAFPQELARTKPYGYSLFNLDAMAALCMILSTPDDNLWTYTTSDGRGMRKAVDFMLPFIIDKASWPYAHDVMCWENWPVAQPSMLFAWEALADERCYEAWRRYDHFPRHEEVLRNLPLRNPIIWLTGNSGKLRHRRSALSSEGTM